MKSWEIAFTGSWPAALVLPLVVGAVLLAWRFYSRRRDEVGRAGFRWMVALRMVAICIVALFLLEPVLRLTRAEATRSTVVVLVDTSRSMSIRDAAAEQSRLEAARSLLAGTPADLLRRLRAAHDVRLYRFDAVTAELAGRADLESLESDGPATALGDALRDVVREVGRDAISAVVLLTDGVSNLGDEPGAVARRMDVPIFPVALGGQLGERGRFHDVGFSAVPRNPRFIVNNRALVRLELSHVGLADFTEPERRVTVTLREDGRELASRSLLLPAHDGTTEVELEYTPDRVGVRRLRAEVSEVPAETVLENNTRSFTVHVTDPRIRLLIVEGTVRNEHRFLRRVLESDPNIEATGVVKLSGRRYLVQGVQPGVDLSRGLPARPEDYEEFDVVILGDIGRNEFTGVQLEQLRDFVDGGGGLMALGGHRAFGAGRWEDSALAGLLPVSLGGVRDGHLEDEFAPVMTPEGARHPVLLGCGRFFEEPQARVTLEGANRLRGLKPGAAALLVHPHERADGAPMPVLAAQAYGSGRVLALAADTTWRWKFQVEATGRESPYYRLWRQSVRWLAGRDEPRTAPDRLVSAWSERVEYEPGEAATLRARVRADDGEPLEGARVRAVVRYPVPVRRQTPEGEEELEQEAEVPLTAVPLSPGEYRAAWEPPAAGLYRAQVRAAADGQELGSDEVEFVLGHVASEFDRVDVDRELLQSLAATGGGVYHTQATAARIPDELEQRRRLVLRREEYDLWNAPWFLAAFVACVTAEWVLRKRRGLS